MLELKFGNKGSAAGGGFVGKGLGPCHKNGDFFPVSNEAQTLEPKVRSTSVNNGILKETQSISSTAIVLDYDIDLM